MSLYQPLKPSKPHHTREVLFKHSRCSQELAHVWTWLEWSKWRQDMFVHILPQSQQPRSLQIATEAPQCETYFKQKLLLCTRLCSEVRRSCANTVVSVGFIAVPLGISFQRLSVCCLHGNHIALWLRRISSAFQNSSHSLCFHNGVPPPRAPQLYLLLDNHHMYDIELCATRVYPVACTVASQERFFHCASLPWLAQTRCYH